MAERPLIIFPEPDEVERHKIGGGDSPLHIPSSNRQKERLSPKFDSLRQSFERSKLQSSPAGVEPEMVLVLETIGRIDDFINTVKRIEGLEWLAAQDEDLIAPDEDFYHVNNDGEKLEKDLPGRLYLVMSNADGMQQLLSFWKRYKSQPDKGFDRPFGRLYKIFSCLKDIRPWGAEDRLRETGLLEDWQCRVEEGVERVRVEIELWYRQALGLRSKIEDRLIAQVKDLDGAVLAKTCIGDIAYHALLAELPVALVEDFRNNSNISLLHCDQVMSFRPVGQIADVIPYEESELESWQGGELPIPQDNPVVALLDGLPLENHGLLAEHLIVDDPDDWATDYVVRDRKHGTAMASLILHGELDAHDSILPSRIYVRPIMKPGLLDFQTNERIEGIPENILPVDIVYRAVRRMFDSDGEEPASAPTVRVINLSIADPARPLDRFPSSWARLLDWLSWKYSVLFVVSAGNYTKDIEMSDTPRGQFDALKSDELLCSQQTCKALNDDTRHRRLLSPAESINSLTVASIHSDNSEGVAYPSHILDPLPINTLAFPSPLNAQGAGFRRSVKPDLLFPGGRQLYREEMSTSNANVVLKWLNMPRAPGQRVAVPQLGNPTAVGYTRGTSNAAALATRSAAIIYQNLQELFREAEDDGLGNDHVSVLLKALLVHSAYWDNMSDVLTQYLDLEVSNRQNVCSRLLGYGRADVERVISCTDQRATLLGWGNITDDRAHRYSLPLPSSLNGRNEWRKITITLAWFSPINPDHQSYRRAALWFAPYGHKEARKKAVDGPEGLLGVSRREADWQAARRGTVQHEIFEGQMAAVFEQDSESVIQVNCRADAGKLVDEIPYALAVTLEVAPEIDLPIYQEIVARIRPRVRPSVLG